MMGPDSEERSQPSAPNVFLVGRPGPARKALDTHLSTISADTCAVKTILPQQVKETLDPLAVGVVCLSTDHDTEPTDGEITEASRDDRDDLLSSVSEIVSEVDETDVECPVAVVGEDIDVRSVYKAGASDVVPLSPAEHPELTADRIAGIIDTPIQTDDSTGNHELVDALSRAYPDYAFVYDEEGRYLDVMTGHRTDDPLYDEEELLGRTVHDILSTETANRIVEGLQAALSSGEVKTIEYNLHRPDETTWYRARIAPLAEPFHGSRAAVLVARDITDRKERKRELERAQRRFDAVFNAPSALVTLLDTEGRIEEISDAAVALVPEPREDIRGRFLWEGPWFENDARLQAEFREAVEGAIAGESTRVKAALSVPNQELVIDAMFEPVTDDGGRLEGVLGIARDITERHRDQRIRRQLLSSTREMIGAKSREQLANIVSQSANSVLGHDLNVVYLRDGNETGDPRLAPVAWTDRIAELFDDPPTPTGSGPVSEVAQQGEPAIYDSLEGVTERPAAQYDPIKSLVVLPLGEHGVLAVGATAPGAFADVDIDRYQLLTISAATAFDRLDRTLELQRYETLFETVQDRVYVLDEDGVIELISESLATKVGYNSDDLVGKNVSTVVTEETAKEVERLILDLLVTPEDVGSTCEGTLVARDGTEIPVEIELSVLPHEGNFRGTAGVVRDISERRQREEELRVFQQAITEAGIGLAMYGADGRFEYVNDRYADLLGRPRGEVKGSPVWETFVDLDPEEFDAYWAGVSADETETKETEHVRGDGSTVPVETVTTAVDIDGIRHHILTIQDITDRREQRQQAQALHRIFRHNLRNDLTVLYGHSTILAEELPAEFETNIEAIVEKTQNLTELTETANQARTVLNSDTRREPIDAVELIREQVADLRERADVSVETDLPDECLVLADSTLGIAIDHLLTNAVEHSDSPSPRVWVRIAEAPDRKDWVPIEIADNGPGVPDIERETLAAGKEGKIQHSVGLGLWIVRWIISRYGGDLSFHDREPRGTRIRIGLPAAPEETLELGSPEELS